ncbi:histone-lysine N-methyltransferase ATXR2-like isoform X1 [Prosopis cineraria]|uniref:histone-lysine N-methyltransferase ATXR2-like isoform X1 n=1 Tax=Prosopis cineraria TaxID=364024 RepID=UPI00240EDCDC|nr:histone-lysine N-methyltransferase ATXR2-like isoform X1 [Prosopis cineraria]
MESICPIDSRCANEIAALLSPPSPLQVQEYYHKLLSARKCSSIIVQQDENFGKGVYAAIDFNDAELVLKDQMLVGVQHSSNKIDCFVCSSCFCFLGSIELQIGRRLYMQEVGASESHNCDMSDSSNASKYNNDTYSSDGEESSYKKREDGAGECSFSSPEAKVHVPEGVVQSLMNGHMMLPYSNKFSLPPAVPCPGGCGESFYCSTSCAEADWKSCHSLICTGEKSDTARREALLKFIKHANETNDIFLLAAKAISSTIVRYHKLKESCLLEQGKHDTSHLSNHCDLTFLLESWRPIAMGHKRRWWDCVALPDDINSYDEVAFRMQIRDLAFESLQLLKKAIFDRECEPLFSLEIYGHIIGMFEQNNLDLVVASPVEDYFLYIDNLTYPEKEKAEEITQPILDALGEDYSICCQGTAFFPLQSCMNHSCCPNAKAFKREEDRDGQATIIALTSIRKGEEITISYVDEDLPFEERQASLADYGFRCRCPKCIEEQP